MTSGYSELIQYSPPTTYNQFLVYFYFATAAHPHIMYAKGTRKRRVLRTRANSPYI